MPPDGYFDDDTIDQAFESPQAKFIRQAALAADKKREELRRLREKDRPSSAEAANANAEFAAVARGAAPMHVPKPKPLYDPKRARYRQTVQVNSELNDPPRPGRTGAISGTMAMEAIKDDVRKAKEPREAARRWIEILTTELIALADELDPIQD